MFFLLRCAFWLTIALALLPSGGQIPAAKGPQVSATEALVAAGSAVSDVGSFCDRQAEACEVGAQAAVAIGQRAQAGAKMVFEFINERVSHGETGSVPARRSQSAAADRPQVHPAALSAQNGSQHTLSPADLAPQWQNPPARQEMVPLPRARGAGRPA